MKNLRLLMALLIVMSMSISSCQKAIDFPVDEALAEAQDLHLMKNPSKVNKLLADVRKATTQYHDVNAAIAAGYVNTVDCVTGPPGAGAMGIHFVNFDLIDDVFNPLEPEILLYERMKNGSYKLVGVEYLFVGSESPLFAGEVAFHPFHQPFADYALHVWIWKGNPNGIFEDFNVNVKCL